MSTTLSRRASALLMFAALLLASCSSKDPSPVPGAGKQGTDSARVIFRDAKGRELTEADLAGFTGSFKWEVVGGASEPTSPVPVRQPDQPPSPTTQGQKQPRRQKRSPQGFHHRDGVAFATSDRGCRPLPWRTS